MNTDSRLPSTLNRFAQDAYERATTLSARFVWCSLLAWPTITDDDVATFTRLKKARNRLSHGDLTFVPVSLATKTGALARKLADAWLRGSQGSGDSIRS